MEAGSSFRNNPFLRLTMMAGYPYLQVWGDNPA